MGGNSGGVSSAYAGKPSSTNAARSHASLRIFASLAFCGSIGQSGKPVNHIVSKLAREHPENPVHLRGSLLGVPPTFMPTEKKPPNPFAQKDELPKLPKIDWTVYDNHRIDGNTRVSHDDWARIINSTKDFGGIIPTMVRTIQ
jgi:hypothetical protein